MAGIIAKRMNRRRRLPLLAAGLAAVALPICIGVFTAPSSHAQTQTSVLPQFDVASVKISKSNERARRSINGVPSAGRLVITGMTVKEVIQGAYGIQSFELVAVDSPVLSERIDIEARADHPVASMVQLQQMLQPLLADRFKLAVHHEMRETNALALVLARKDGRLGPKMKQTDSQCDALGTGVTRFVLADSAAQSDRPACGFAPSGVGRIVGTGLDMPGIVGLLAPSQGRSIVDQTGLQGRYDIDVTYTPQPFSSEALAQRGGTLPPGVNVDPNGPSLFNALEEQLGLKLESKKMAVPVVVIDHIEPLGEN
jgi:uncharacterized protein (TIGR03435 family)